MRTGMSLGFFLQLECITQNYSKKYNLELAKLPLQQIESCMILSFSVEILSMISFSVLSLMCISKLQSHRERGSGSG